MGNVISMSTFLDERRHEEEQAMLAEHKDVHPGQNKLFKQDYTTLAGVLNGVLMIRTMLDSHMHYQEEWKHHLLTILSEAHSEQGKVTATMLEHIQELRGIIVSNMHAEIKRDMATCLLILDLIQKAPSQRKRFMH